MIQPAREKYRIFSHYIYNTSFHSPKFPERYLGEMPPEIVAKLSGWREGNVVPRTQEEADLQIEQELERMAQEALNERGDGNGKVLLEWPEQVFLFRRYNGAKYFGARLLDFGRVSRNRFNLDRFMQAALSARSNLAIGNLPLVLSRAKKEYIPDLPGVSFEDILAEGNQTLLKAIDGFDVSKGNRFSTYFSTAASRNYLRFAVRSHRDRVRGTVGFDSNMGIEECFRWREKKQDQVAEDLLDDTRDILIAIHAGKRIGGISEKEAAEIKIRYPLRSCCLTFEAAGRILRVTKERVRQLEISALAKIKAYMCNHVLHWKISDEN